MRTIYSDVLCIGAGLAGERVALAAAMEGFHTICLSVVPPRRSHSSAAQGGMQAALGNAVMGKGDSTDIHFADTVKGSDWGCDQEVARIFADSAPIVMREMAHWGVPWNRVVAGKHTYYKGGKPFEAEEEESKHGLIHARAFGGTAKWRTCYTADGTGRSVLNTLDSKCLQYGVEIHDRMQAEALIHDGERVDRHPLEARARGQRGIVAADGGGEVRSRKGGGGQGADRRTFQRACRTAEGGGFM